MIYEKNKKLRLNAMSSGGPRLTGYMINECCITGAVLLMHVRSGINSTDGTTTTNLEMRFDVEGKFY